VHPLLFVLALARPTEVLEEWTLLETAPVRELVTARVVYDRNRGPEIALPTVFDGDRTPPSVELVGHLRPLVVTRVGASWHARLPEPTSTPRPRVVVRSVREARDVRLFQLRWPVTNGEAIRRVAIVPRGWMQVMSEGWTCADDSISSIACVSIDTRPNPLRVRVSPLASSRGAWIATAVFSLAMCALLALRKPKQERLAVAATWLVGLVATSSVALTLVGARWTPWSVALSSAALSATALAALVGSDEHARRTGAIAALAIALLSVFDGRPARSLVALAVAFVALVGARCLSRAYPRPSPPRTDPQPSEAEESRRPSP
jgi:hypothetical protein